MRIKKLELVGFKSFKDRTVVQFDQGITGIVGPNGCGKSNIVDALVWVMGEMSAKHLRGSSMEDVIFAGAEGYAPVGLAEVSLTLENEGGPFPAKYSRFSELMITRRLHRSGESEYLINREPVRLRDIQEIFMDTGAGSKGFSIIEQGAIGKIITAKPEERRVLIEEAAGITKFKVRKRESQKKLQATDQNLVRLQDILGEQKRQLDSLERQAQRADRYRKIKAELKEKEIWLGAKTYLSLHSEAELAATELSQAQTAEASSSATIQKAETDVARLRLEVVEKQSLVDEAQRQHQTLQEKSRTLEKEIRELQFEIEQARRNREMTGNILEQYRVRREALQRDEVQLRERFVDAQASAAEIAAEFSRQEAEFLELQKKIQSADQDLTTQRREMLAVAQSESHIEARLIALEAQLEEVSGRLEHAREVLAELTSRREDFLKRRQQLRQEFEAERQMQLDLANDVETLNHNLQHLETQSKTKAAEVAEYKDELNQVASRLYGLENLHNSFEGFEDGVRQVLLWQRERQKDSGVGFQPVAEVVEVPSTYELAMEAALGQKLQMLLSPSYDSSLDAVEYLKEKKSGRSSFYAGPAGTAHPVSRPAAEDYRSTLRSEGGVVALLDEVVQAPESYRAQVHQFTSDVVIVENMRTALELWQRYPGLAFVTLDGDTLSAEGVLSGGSSEGVESGVIKRRREIKELSQAREEWAGKLALAQAALKKIEAQVETLTVQLNESRQRSNEKEIRLAELRKDLERAENEWQQASAAIERQDAETQREEKLLLQYQEKKEELASALASTKEKKMAFEAEAERLNQILQHSREGIDERQDAVTKLKVAAAAREQEAQGLRMQIEMVEKNLRQVEGELGQMSEESERSTASLSTNQVLVERSRVDLEGAIRETEAAAGKLARIRNDYEEMEAELRKKEDELGQALRGIGFVRSQMSEAERRLEQFRLKEQFLLDQIHEKYILDLRTVAENYRDQSGEVTEIEAQVEELRQKVSRIGEVNLSAIEEYEELKGRNDFLAKQYDDLLAAKEQLRKVIERINRICSRRFKETFEQVNERFEKVFPVLFGGGEARLILVEDESGDGDMGIDIVSRPPGKKLQNVSLLSGGEKALTAVSLIFAIFLVKPSPFCLLDEVDAPLDDANVFRFNDLVKEMAKRSQIIVVTHNKHTMRVNNRLFGVTMQEKGVSKLVSVSLEEAVKAVI